MMIQTVCPNCGGSLRAESHGWICNKCKGFISLQDGKFYEYVEKPFMPPMTNADRIRAMTDEGLMQLLFTKISCGNICSFCVPTMRTESKCDGHCRNGVLKWLQQPAEGGMRHA